MPKVIEETTVWRIPLPPGTNLLVRYGTESTPYCGGIEVIVPGSPEDYKGLYGVRRGRYLHKTPTKRALKRKARKSKHT